MARGPEGEVGFRCADIMLARTTRSFTASGVLARCAAGIFEREEREIEEQRVQFQALDAFVRW
jgi:hypothetical protein